MLLSKNLNNKILTIDIEATELQWSDGKAKLAMAIQAQKAPDIMHIGLEWVQEFAQGKSFASFSFS
jgi:ABC-type glycerol-3-phosphate transport system substrate-binding protein